MCAQFSMGNGSFMEVWYNFIKLNTLPKAVLMVIYAFSPGTHVDKFCSETTLRQWKQRIKHHLGLQSFLCTEEAQVLAY